MVKKLLFVLFFQISFLLFAEENATFHYYDPAPFIFTFNGVNIPLLGNGEDIRQQLGPPDKEFERNGKESLTGFDEVILKYGNYTVVRYNPVSKNILNVTTNNKDISVMGIKPIGMLFDDFLKSIKYSFQEMEISEKGFYYYSDLSSYRITGMNVDRQIEGALFLTVVVQNDIITRMYMSFSEYAP